MRNFPPGSLGSYFGHGLAAGSFQRQWGNMRSKEFRAFVEEDTVAELNHQINSPLAAIRNALYLIESRCADPEVRRYLRLADEEVGSIAAILQTARQSVCTAQAVTQARAASAGRRGTV